jgi:hypothetical protein
MGHFSPDFQLALAQKFRKCANTIHPDAELSRKNPRWALESDEELLTNYVSSRWLA